MYVAVRVWVSTLPVTSVLRMKPLLHFMWPRARSQTPPSQQWGQLGFPPHTHQTLPPLKRHLGRDTRNHTCESSPTPYAMTLGCSIYKLIHSESYKVSSRAHADIASWTLSFSLHTLVAIYLESQRSRFVLGAGHRPWFLFLPPHWRITLKQCDIPHNG